MQNALHFVGFVHPAQAHDPNYDRAVRLFGVPDFVHRRYDWRAKAEIMPGDVAVFAKHIDPDAPATHAFDDSEAMQKPHGTYSKVALLLDVKV